MDFDLERFIIESNMIEGITRHSIDAEVQAHIDFLAGPVTVEALERFVDVIQPGVELRRHEGMNVRVGKHIPPRGGPHIEEWLEHLLIPKPETTPYQRHCAYEILHPFMDGNGRSGRVLWLHNMGGIEKVPLGFLHTFYYQALAAGEGRRQT